MKATFDLVATASPPDMRLGFALLRCLWAQGRTKGPSPKLFEGLLTAGQSPASHPAAKPELTSTNHQRSRSYEVKETFRRKGAKAQRITLVSLWLRGRRAVSTQRRKGAKAKKHQHKTKQNIHTFSFPLRLGVLRRKALRVLDHG